MWVGVCSRPACVDWHAQQSGPSDWLKRLIETAVLQPEFRRARAEFEPDPEMEPVVGTEMSAQTPRTSQADASGPVCSLSKSAPSFTFETRFLCNHKPDCHAPTCRWLPERSPTMYKSKTYTGFSAKLDARILQLGGEIEVRKFHKANLQFPPVQCSKWS